MPLRLNVGVSKKLGLPEFSSIGASCNLELEVDPMLIHHDLEGLHAQIRGAFVAARQAVDDELARLQAQATTSPPFHAVPATGTGHRNGSETPPNGSTATSKGTPSRTNGAGRPPKPATAKQVRAIVTIARRQHADLEGLLRDEYGVTRPEDLSLADASRFIDQLKAAGAI